MPRKMYRSRAKARRTARKKYRPRLVVTPRNAGTLVGRTVGFPKMLKFKHKYQEDIALSDTGALVNYLYSCNGMYDPNITSTGHQPMYFDQLSALYDHYTVIGSKIKYTIVPQGTTAQVPYKIITWINDDTTTTGTTVSLAENKFAKVRYCQGGLNPDKLVMTNTWSAKKFFSSPMANDELKGTASANPAEQSYFQISFRSLDGVSTVSVYVNIEIEYIAVWRELKEIVVS